MNLFIISSCVFFASIVFVSKNKTLLMFLIKSLLPLMAILFIAALIIYPKTSVSSASKGIKLWFEIVFPSLFPFFVASQLLSKSGIVSLFGVILEPIMRPLFNVPGCGSFALAMGVVSGYPVGATITAELRKQETISRIEAERLLTFTNNSGPLFIMGAVAVGMFNQPKLGYLLYTCHIAACLTVGFIFRYYRRGQTKLNVKVKQNMTQNLKIELKRLRNSDMNPWSLFGDCIKNSVYTILAIGGFIIFFSVMINIMINCGLIAGLSNIISVFSSAVGLGYDAVQGILCGFFEITTGANLISQSPASLTVKLCCVSLIIGWAGFSVHTQVMSIVSSTDIRVKPYLIGKALQGVISCFYTFIGYSFFSSFLLKESPAFANNPEGSLNQWGNVFKASIQLIGLWALIMVVALLACICIIKVKSKKSLL